MLIRAICYLLLVATISLRAAGRDGHGVGVDGFSKDERRQPFNYAIFAESLEELWVVFVKLIKFWRRANYCSIAFDGLFCVSQGNMATISNGPSPVVKV